ncbi:MAG: hypothetical protein SFX73_35585 [Kofleriaceae bacterium]|nr:hypothetical protein [Kofleriaceae bacterium]
MGSRLVVALLAACSSPAPKAPTPPTDHASSPYARTWIVAEHVLVKGTSATERDAAGFHGRTVDITATGFMSPWHGTCERASRVEQPRTINEVVTELRVVIEDRAKIDLFGFVDPTTEYRFVCDEGVKTPLTILIGGDKAMTCFGGACYLLNKF